MTVGQNSGHLTDEQVSDLIDGMATPDEARHADECADSAARVGAWRQAVRLTSTPVPVSESHREAAVSAALELFQSPTGRPHNVEALESRPRRRWRSAGLAWSAAAAAVILLVAGLSLAIVHTGGGHSNKASTALGSRPAGPAVPSVGPSVPPASAQSAPTAVFLGTFTDMPSVVAAVRNPDGSASASGSKSAESSGTGASSGTTVPGNGGTGATPAPTAVPADLSSCRARAGAVVALPGVSPVYSAALTYRGVAAAVFVFSSRTTHVVVVLGTRGCALLGRSSY